MNIYAVECTGRRHRSNACRREGLRVLLAGDVDISIDTFVAEACNQIDIVDRS